MEMAKIFALPESVVHEGQEYKISQITLKIEAEWEEWMISRAWRTVKQSASRSMNPIELEYRLVKDIAAGEYAYGSNQSINSAYSPPGRLYMLFLRIRAFHPEVQMDTVREIWKRYEDEIAEKLARLDDPKVDSPADTNQPGQRESSHGE